MSFLFSGLTQSALVASGIVQALLYTNPAFVTGRARQAFNSNPTMLPDLSLLVAMKVKGAIQDGEYTTMSRQAGFTESLSTAALATAEQLLGAHDYITLWRRGAIPETELEHQLSRMGFSPESIEGIKTASEYFPPPPDLIRFAVREVYNTALRSQFGMDEDISDRFLAEAKKAGLPDEQARNYWASHWELPSIQQGFEMLHRRVISESELSALLKAKDVMPFWREGLSKISYNPLTRVDVRRMHAMGLIDDGQLLDRYKDLGFNTEDAGMMVKFTKAYNSREEAGVTSSKVTEAYRKGIISFVTAQSLLGDIGLSNEARDLILQTAEYDRIMNEADDFKADLFQQYINGVINKETVRMRLTGLGAPAQYVAASMAELDRKEASKVKLPTKADLVDWFKIGILGEQEFKLRMEEIGYRESDVILYMTEIAIESESDEVRYLGDTVYIRWLKKEMITIDRFRQIMEAKGVSLEDTENYLAEVLGE